MAACRSFVLAAFLATCPAMIWAAEESGLIVDHKTLYQTEPIGDARRFELRGSIRGKAGTGTILLETNQCKLNEFGDRMESQLALVAPIAVTFKQIEGEVVDPSPKKNRQIFAIARTEGEPPLPNLLLMVAADGPWRLIYLDRAGNRRAITLEPSRVYDGLAK